MAVATQGATEKHAKAKKKKRFDSVLELFLFLKIFP